MSSPAGFEGVVARVLSGEAPENVRAAAARGALPLPRATLVRLQIGLLGDAEPAVRAAAEASLRQLDAKSLRDVLADPTCASQVLLHFAHRAARDEALAEALAFHANVSPDVLAILAAEGTAPVAELVLTNQEVLLEQPRVLECLMNNPTLRPDQRGRLLELIERGAKMRSRAPSADDGEAAERSEREELEELARLLEVDVGELYAASEILGGEELELSEDLDIRSMYRKILTLSTAQKAILAMKGGREERMILIRDSNKLVALGVLRNGRITENEIEAMARMRNVTEEVLRNIGIHREWTKGYGVILALVHNPRAPQSVTTNFVARLTNKDLKALAGSRDVPELIRRMAKRTLDTRTQKTSSFKKK